MSSKYYLKILLSIDALEDQGEEALVSLKALINAQCFPDYITSDFSYPAQVPLTIVKKYGPEWFLWGSRMRFYLRGSKTYRDTHIAHLTIGERVAPRAVHVLKLGLAEFCQAYGIELLIQEDRKLQAFMRRHIVT